MTALPPRRPTSRQASAAVLQLLVLLGTASVLRAGPEATPTAVGRDWRPTAEAVDAAFDAALSAAGITPAPASDDGEFLRRVRLDLTGTLPTAQEAREFLADRTPGKRERKVEALLASDDYASFWSHWWYRVLTGLTPGASMQRGQADNGGALLRGPATETFQSWLLEQVRSNRPYDAFVHDLLTATGRTNANGATGFYARWEGKPNELAGAVSKTFLGVKIQCAQCHDHMYEPTWKQKDFQGMASFFVLSMPRPVPEYQQAYREIERAREARQKERTAGGEPAMEGGEAQPKARQQRAEASEALGMTPAEKRQAQANPRVVDIVDLDPRLLQLPPRRADNDKLNEVMAERRALASVTPKAWMGPALADLPGLSRREMLARWVTAPTNPYFATAIANRMVGHLFGRGIVNPIDDFTSMNPPSHPEVLERLAADLKANGYDLKRLLRILVNTRAYQRTSHWEGAHEPDPQLFARGAVKSLSSEQMFEALMTATGGDVLVEAANRRTRGALAGKARELGFAAFSFVFEDDEGAEAEDFAGNIPQGLFLLNGRLLQSALTAVPGTTLTRALAEHDDDKERLEALWLAAYTRLPTADERRTALSFVRRGTDDRSGGQALFWALLNSADFMSTPSAVAARQPRRPPRRRP
ncbi:MAG: DUF1549 and DUF1553 domain-containing protein, partial [Planctomycetia bacterium]